MRVTPRRATAAIASAMLIGTMSLPAMAQDASEAPAGSPAASGDAWPTTGTLKDGSTFTLKQSIQDKLALELGRRSCERRADPVPVLVRLGQHPAVLAAVPRRLRAQHPRGAGDHAAALGHADRAGIGAPGREPADRADPGALGSRAHRLPVDPVHRHRTPSRTSPTRSWPRASRSSPWASSRTATSSRTSPRSAMNEGHQAAQIVLDWMEATGNDLKVFAVSGGDPPQNWAPGPDEGLHRRHQGRHPRRDVHQRRDHRPRRRPTIRRPTYDAYTALCTATPSSSSSRTWTSAPSTPIAPIVDAGREGQVFTIGWNVSEGQLDAVEQGIQVAALDQKWADQAALRRRRLRRLPAERGRPPEHAGARPGHPGELEAGSRGVPSDHRRLTSPSGIRAEPGDAATPVARLDRSPTPRQPGERA